jgi:UrcA family protein
MIRSVLLALAIAGASISPAGVAIAQPGATTDEADRAAITVVVPRPRQTDRSYTGIPIETLTAQSIVYIDDLNLRTEAGRSELNARVKAAAQSACDWLDELYPLAEPGNAECVSEAVRRAESQIDAALATAM